MLCGEGIHLPQHYWINFNRISDLFFNNGIQAFPSRHLIYENGEFWVKTEKKYYYTNRGVSFLSSK